MGPPPALTNAPPAPRAQPSCPVCLLGRRSARHDILQFLIKKRVDIDAGDNFRVTAMHLAAIEDFPEIVDALLKARADPKPSDVEGDQPIHWAATKGHAEVGAGVWAWLGLGPGLIVRSVNGSPPCTSNAPDV